MILTPPATVVVLAVAGSAGLAFCSMGEPVERFRHGRPIAERGRMV